MAELVTWLQSLVSVVRRVPHMLDTEVSSRRRQANLLGFLAEEEKNATWICDLHGDAWRRPDGSLRRLYGDLVLPLSVADAEDMHGYARRRGERSW